VFFNRLILKKERNIKVNAFIYRKKYDQYYSVIFNDKIVIIYYIASLRTYFPICFSCAMIHNDNDIAVTKLKNRFKLFVEIKQV